MAAHRPLKQNEIDRLEAAGCTAAAWPDVQVTDATSLERIRDVHFTGPARIGALNGDTAHSGPAELRNATLHDVVLGDNVRIVNVAGCVSAMEVEDGAALSGVGRCHADPDADFAIGTMVEAVNEGGGREVPLSADLSSNIAWMMAMYNWRPGVVKALRAMVEAEAAEAKKAPRGRIGAGASIENVAEITNARIGAHARIEGAQRLSNVTILSEEAARTFIGANVVLDECVVAEGAKIDSGAILDKCFAGQACKIGRTFSGENCLMFANGEYFHSEGVAIFGGPYTVTHHRSTLLIAGVFSFYNAGSNTNMSNHMYKLGPVHQGVLERGSKTASGSYMLFPCVAGPFSVVMGKNMANFDLADFPFSYITAESDGTNLTPAMNLFTVGTTRDGAKWPKRDRRSATNKRDLLHFDVYSPFTVGRMLAGEKVLNDLADSTDKKEKTVRLRGAIVKRLLLRHGAKNYATAIDRYLYGEVLAKAGSDGKCPPAESGASASAEWVDMGGLLVSRDRQEALLSAIEKGEAKTLADVQKLLASAHAAYEADAWAWVRRAFEERHGQSVDSLDAAAIEEMKAKHRKLNNSFTKKILADAEKEFDDIARIGFGADGGEGARDADFESVRGTADENGFIQGLRADLE